jgi:hypothetical protein
MSKFFTSPPGRHQFLVPSAPVIIIIIIILGPQYRAVNEPKVARLSKVHFSPGLDAQTTRQALHIIRSEKYPKLKTPHVQRLAGPVNIAPTGEDILRTSLVKHGEFGIAFVLRAWEEAWR